VLLSGEERGVRMETFFLGASGLPRNSPAGPEGWARQVEVYGPSGEVLERTFWKADPLGVLRFWRRLDGKGRLVESVNLAADGSPALWPSGAHRWTERYSSRGNAVEGRNFGLDGKPVVTAWGFHRWLARHDRQGRRLELAHFGINGEPAFRTEDDTFRILWRYGATGNLEETLLLGPNGRPRNGKLGWARQLNVYDASGRLVKTAFWRARPDGTLDPRN
jgi:hypothetical protein